MDIKYLKDNNLIIYETISGSKAYGTNLPTSDTDIRGVFILPEYHYFGIPEHSYISEVKDEKGDNKYYELNRFLDLLYQNKPDVVEMAFNNMVTFQHKVWDIIDPTKFLTKKCGKAFSGFAQSQIKKATGLNKAINNPQPKVRKSILEFCYLIDGVETKKLSDLYSINDLKNAGVSHVQNGEGLYGLFLDPNNQFNFRGVVNQEETNNSIRLSSIPKEWYNVYSKPVLFHFNMNGYKVHCKQHKNYWEWVEKRNQDRYRTNIEHGKNYDSKNLCHTMRGLNMAIEILKGEGVNVMRTNDLEDLMEIRLGKREYNSIIEEAKIKIDLVNQLIETTNLPDEIDYKYVHMVAYKIRKQFYG